MSQGKMKVDLSDIKRHSSHSFGAIGDPMVEPPAVQQVLRSLGLTPHTEGGYFVETDRDEQKVARAPNDGIRTVNSESSVDPKAERHLSTSIIYCLTPRSPIGAFHRNASKTVHTLHRGRGIYVVLTPKEDGVDIEAFVVGHNFAKGERLQWIVEGGSYKASFLIPDEDEHNSSVLLISETVVPGFEYDDHDFLHEEALLGMVRAEDFDKLKWLLRERFHSGQYSN